MFAMCIGLGLLALGCLHTLPLFALLYLVLPRRWHRPVSRRIIRSGFSFYLAVLRHTCQVRLDLDELAPLRQAQGPLIVIANHPSLLDAVLLLSVLPQASCVLKAGLLQTPCSAWAWAVSACWACCVFTSGPRSSRSSSARRARG